MTKPPPAAGPTPDDRDPEERFGACDDSLVEDAPPPPAPARPWLAKQRFVHGMLRALNTADADAREARVQAVLAQLSPTVRLWPRVLGPRVLGQRVLAAAAALAVCALGYALWPSLVMPRAEAMVARAIASLDQPVDRAFELHIEVERNGRASERRVDVVMRPGRLFLANLEGPFGQMRVGCDGERVWMKAKEGPFRFDVPYTEARRLSERLGDVLDLGYLDLDQLLRRLPQDTALRSVGRQDGCVRVEATGTVKLRHLELRAIHMLVDDRTGMLRAIEAVATSPENTRSNVGARLHYRHVGDRELTADAYRRPW